MVWCGHVCVFLVLIPLAWCGGFFEDGALENVDIMNMFSAKCEFNCKNGAKPTVNKNHKHKAKTCGKLGKAYKFLESHKADMTSCCDQLHTCYETCKNQKSACDEGFRGCMEEMCKENFVAETEAGNACEHANMMMYTSVIALGCDSYISGQKASCHCKHRQNPDIAYEEL